MKVIFVDFDETIFQGDYNNPPSEDCLFVLNQLKKQGHEIDIYSFRTNSKEHSNWVTATQDMIEYLDKYKVPYNRIVSNKPYYDYIIDDRAIGVPLDEFNQVNWSVIRKLLK